MTEEEVKEENEGLGHFLSPALPGAGAFRQVTMRLNAHWPPVAPNAPEIVAAETTIDSFLLP